MQQMRGYSSEKHETDSPATTKGSRYGLKHRTIAYKVSQLPITLKALQPTNNSTSNTCRYNFQ
jgi:hypothetical protein